MVTERWLARAWQRAEGDCSETPLCGRVSERIPSLDVRGQTERPLRLLAV